MRNWFKPKSQQVLKKYETLSELIDDFKKSKDFIEFYNQQSPRGYYIYYFSPLVDSNILHQEIISNINKLSLTSIDEIVPAIPIEEIIISNDLDTISKNVLHGSVLVRLTLDDDSCVLIPATKSENRQVSVPEVEFSVVGPKEAFVESLDTNLNLIRKRLPIPELRVEFINVGELTKTKVAVLHIDGITNQENVDTAIQRIRDIKIDHMIDSSYISQLIADNTRSPFQQSLDTERPDRVTAALSEGSVIILTDGSPHALLVPTTIIEFFASFEDYYLHWTIASGFRLIRLFSVIFSILATPFYVAVTTYHYVLIPKDLLNTLVASRNGVPLPPILEALFLELAIELLREAGARLPTKVGQTIGIVGGIVIGTASVEAGLTSNVLLIIVALAALGSFTTPVYRMGNTIRLLRFPFLISAYLFGFLGVAVCFCFIMIHLLSLTSLGRPYLEPIYPPRTKDYKDAFIRLPFSFQTKRPIQLQTESTIRFSSKNRKKKQKKDIDD